MRRSEREAFTIVELLVVVAIATTIMSLVLVGVRAARGQAGALVCASNLRQVALANMLYAQDSGGRLCPGAARFATGNLQRWHGRRQTIDEPFDAARGPLLPFLGGDGGIRQCPAATEIAPGFERGNGGYGYNNAYIGVLLEEVLIPGFYRIASDESGAMQTVIRRPADTLMFADAAFAQGPGLIEYSFAEPRFWVASPDHRADPSIHFRHDGQANVAWCDGHVDRRRRTFSWTSSLYPGSDPEARGIGWFGDQDDNGFFDL